MFNISQYLEKFKNIGGTERNLKEALAGAVKTATGVEIEVKNIIIKNGEAIIKVSPLIKNAIYIKKEKILKLVEEKIGCGVVEIR
jgi:hypothetical protein